MSRLKIVLTLVILITLLAGPAAAFAQIPAANAPVRAQAGAGLAAYFPRETLVYASVDTSAGRIETLDALLARIQAALPPELMDPSMTVSVTTLLDMVAQEINGKTFAESVRPWLGSEIALGVYPPDNLFDYNYDNDDLMPFVLAVSITDRGAAAGYALELLAMSGMIFNVEQTPAYDLFDVESYDFTGYVMVRDDVLLVATEQAYLPMDGLPADSLATNPTFAETLAQLPGADYGAVAFVDTAMLLANAIGSEYNDDPAARLLLTLVLRMVGPMAVGATVLEGDTLTLDLVQTLGNVTAMEALGVNFTPLPATDLAFLGQLPQSSALIIEGNGIAQIYENGMKIGQTLVDRFVVPELYDQLLADQQAAMLLELGDLLLGGLAGFSFARDLRPWLQGDFAIFAGYNPGFRPAGPIGAENFPIHMGAVFEVSEDGGDAARTFVEMFGRELELALRIQGVEGVDIRTMSHGGEMPMVTMTFADSYGYELNLPDVVTLALATDGKLMVFGTLAAVDAVLLGTEPRFEPDMPELLEDASIVLYAGLPALLPLVDLMEADMTSEDSEALRLLLTLIERATISVTSTPDGGGVLRATLTLGG